MTRERAAEVLEQERDYLMGGPSPNIGEFDDALEMAIAALRERESGICKNCTNHWISVEDRPPKAYYVREKDSDCATIVFAKNTSQAKTTALSCDCCEDARYIDIRVRRMPEADKLYRGFAEINWYDPEIRVALVRDFGWSCFEPSFECDNCPAKQYCHWHEQEE